jgi:hypothetical protein
MAAVTCATLLLGAAGAAAQSSDQTTFVTFSGPVSVPGTTLPAGTYTFRLAESPANRHIVQIFDRDQSKLFATILAVPAERNTVEGEPVVTFKETPSDMPPALRFWYYAGDKAGNEFVYPKSQAMTIARASGEGVMAVDTDSTDIKDWTGTPTRVTASAEPQSTTTASTTTASTTSSASTASTAPTTSAEPTATPAQPTTTPAQPTTAPTEPMTATTPRTPAQPTTAPAPTTTPRETVGTSGRSEPRELPKTAGELPAVGLIALFALAGAFAVRAMRKAAV